MKIGWIILGCLWISVSWAQRPYSMNQGGAIRKGYYEEIPYTVVMNNHLLVDVEIGGKLRRFIWDSGAPFVVTEKLAKELKMKTVSSISLGDANGKQNFSSIVKVEEVKIGKVAFAGIPACVMPDTALFFDCTGIDGLIGSNLLRESIVQISSNEKKIILTDDRKKLNLKGLKPIRMFLGGNQSAPLITLELMEKVNIELLFDTGSGAFLEINEKNWEGLKKYLPDIPLKAEGEGEAVYSLWGRGKEMKKYLFEMDIKVCGTVFKQVEGTNMRDRWSRLGNRFLQYGRVTMDYRHACFYFEPYTSGVVEVKNEKVPSVVPVWSEGEMRVGLIWGKVPGVAVGDRILKIDGQDVRNIGRCEYLQWKIQKKDRVVLQILTATGEEKEIVW